MTEVGNAADSLVSRSGDERSCIGRFASNQLPFGPRHYVGVVQPVITAEELAEHVGC